MKIYVEFTKGVMRLKAGKNEIRVALKANFYSPITGTESFFMFHDQETNDRVMAFIRTQRNGLSFLGKISYWFLRNKVLALLDNEIQHLVSIDQIYSYSALFLDGRDIAVIRKPSSFDSSRLEDVELIESTYINRGRMEAHATISKLS